MPGVADCVGSKTVDDGTNQVVDESVRRFRRGKEIELVEGGLGTVSGGK